MSIRIRVREAIVMVLEKSDVRNNGTAINKDTLLKADTWVTMLLTHLSHTMKPNNN